MTIDPENAEIDAYVRSMRVTRDVVFFLHQQADYDHVNDDLDYTFFMEQYWQALVDDEADMPQHIVRGCLALLFAMGTYEAGNVGIALGDSLQECFETITRYEPIDSTERKLKGLVLQALGHAATPNERRDYGAVKALLADGEWIHRVVVRPYFQSRGA